MNKNSNTCLYDSLDGARETLWYDTHVHVLACSALTAPCSQHKRLWHGHIVLALLSIDGGLHGRSCFLTQPLHSPHHPLICTNVFYTLINLSLHYSIYLHPHNLYGYRTLLLCDWNATLMFSVIPWNYASSLWCHYSFVILQLKFCSN